MQPLKIAIEDPAQIATVKEALQRAGKLNGNPQLALRGARQEIPTLVTAAELYLSKMVGLRPLLENALWDGLTLFVAPPKAGKSWFALQCAVMVAGGAELRGLNPLERGPVLYGAFEEPAARTMARLAKSVPPAIGHKG